MASQVSDKRSPFTIKGKCFGDCEATLIVGEEKTQVYVCMDTLAKFSEYFRIMFYSDFNENNEKQFKIPDEKADDLVHFFDILIGTDRKTNNITDDVIDLLIRMADKFQCDTLKDRLSEYIGKRVPKCEKVSLILNWLILSVKYHMPQEIIDICLPSVACLPFSTLEANKDKIGLTLYTKVIEAKYNVLCSLKNILLTSCHSCTKTECLCYRKNYEIMFRQ